MLVESVDEEKVKSGWINLSERGAREVHPIFYTFFQFLLQSLFFIFVLLYNKV